MTATIGERVVDPSRSPVDVYLDAQRNVTPVVRFAEAHIANPRPDPATVWRDRIPLTGPGPGEQYAFEVDLDACTGCKSCVTACRSLNGLDHDESWRRVGTVSGVADGIAVSQTVTGACHHCDDPACLSGCPVKAYDKDPTTGIVVHLDDQCIGCRYCELTCPYEVPTFNERLGIVRKCDMCRGRLADGEAPACVQSCPTAAISITTVSTTSVARSGAIVAGAAPSSITGPTTRYVSRRRHLDGLTPADHRTPRPAHGHHPLVALLVLSQVACGTVAIDAMHRITGRAPGPAAAIVGAAIAVAAVVASTFHLGRPHLAWRAVLGVRTSWLSREIVWLGAFCVGSVAVATIDAARGPAPPAAHLVVAALGVAGVHASVMIYAVCGRRWWSTGRVAIRFGATVVGGGATLHLAVGDASARPLVLVGMVIASAVVGACADTEVIWRRGRLDPTVDGDLVRTAALLRGPLGPATAWRLGTAAIAVTLVIVSTTDPAAAPLAIGGAFAGVATSAMERSLFFRAVSSPTMPGHVG